MIAEEGMFQVVGNLTQARGWHGLAPMIRSRSKKRIQKPVEKSIIFKVVDKF
jgi:hypothetical protein